MDGARPGDDRGVGGGRARGVAGGRLRLHRRWRRRGAHAGRERGGVRAHARVAADAAGVRVTGSTHPGPRDAACVPGGDRAVGLPVAGPPRRGTGDSRAPRPRWAPRCASPRRCSTGSRTSRRRATSCGGSSTSGAIARRSAALLRRAQAAGFRAIVWTVDVPVLGLRHRDTRSGFVLPVGPAGTPQEFDPDISWDDLAWIREQVPGMPILVKGVLRPDDAAAAIEHGADGIVVSNHGGRQLDRAPASLDALPGVVAVVGRPGSGLDGRRRSTMASTSWWRWRSARPRCSSPDRPRGGWRSTDRPASRPCSAFLRDGFVNAMANAGCRTVADIDAGLLRPT